VKGLLRGELCMILCAACFFLVCTGYYISQNQGDGAYQVTVSQRAQAAAEGEQTIQVRDWPKTLLPGERIDLNTAPAKDLQRLPQIGAQRAEDIVSWRERKGPFRRVEDLKKVSGIGQGIFEQVEPYITVGKVR